LIKIELLGVETAMASTVAATFPNFSRYITTFDAQGKTVYVNTPNPPPSFAPNAKSRVDYIYSAPASASGPLLADDVDLKEHQVVAAKPPYVLFPGPNGSSCIIGNVSLLEFALFLSPISTVLPSTPLL
jgi:hypothetical protein